MRWLQAAAVTAALTMPAGLSATTPASAMPRGLAAHSALLSALAPAATVIEVRARRTRRVTAGATSGLLLGGVLASQPSYLYRGSSPPAYYSPAYPASGPYSPLGATTASCMRRFRSYDAYSGTYVGFDGMRHPCP